MPTAIIGGTGFTGRRVAEQLVDRGEEVICVDIDPVYNLEDKHDDITVVKGDITDYEQLDEIFAAYEPDRAINLAYMLGAETEADPSVALQVNCVGMDNVFAVSNEHNVDRVLFASSMAVYGLADSFDGAVTEDDIAPAAYSEYPVMFYVATKQLNEYQAKLRTDQSDTDIVSVRPSTIFGPGREGGYTVWSSNFVSKPATGETAYIPHKPEKELTMIYRDDMARLFAEAALADELTYDAYNSGGHYVTAGELAEAVKEVVGGKVICDPNRPGEYPHVATLSNERAREDLGFELSSLENSIRKHANLAEQTT
jgi:UDP-glucose 4-epimerase